MVPKLQERADSRSTQFLSADIGSWCASPKLCPVVASTACISSSKASAITLIHVWFLLALVRRGRCHTLLSLTPKPPAGKLALRQQLTVLKTQAPQTQAQSCGQAVLVARTQVLVRLEAVSHRGHSRNPSSLAPRRISSVLVLAFAPSRSLVKRPTRIELT